MKERIAILLGLLGWVSPLLATQIVGTPEISRSSTGAIVRWQTDVQCGTRAKVEPAAKVTEPPDHAPTTDHRVTVSELKPGVSYQITLGTSRKWLTTQPLTTRNAAANQALTPASKSQTDAPSSRQTWGNPSSLPDHFARHGRDFGATSPDDYARRAWEFLQQAKREGFPAKLDNDGTLRIFDPKTGSFAAYNRNGTTKTFFKPGRPDYFERQPGRQIDLRKQS